MDIIRRKTDYGLRALVALATADGPMRAEELAEREDVPIAFLHKALRDLANAGIVEGQRGPAGGYTLARRADKITMLEAVEAMQGPVAVSRCLLGDDACSRQRTCGLRRAWQEVQRNIASFLSGITVDDLVQALGRTARPRRRKRVAAAARAAA
ncbi:MAG: Rrf2 family transcriptional regulator [Armatimonadota bacterium]|nr:MAG: Rrf2 family transcriptional regulator [Armatimonadota bacterium]